MLELKNPKITRTEADINLPTSQRQIDEEINQIDEDFHQLSRQTIDDPTVSAASALTSTLTMQICPFEMRCAMAKTTEIKTLYKAEKSMLKPLLIEPHP